MKVLDQFFTENSALYHGDSAEVMRGIPNESVGLSVFSPPFSSLYTFSNSERDVSNVKDLKEFMKQYRFMMKELFRIMKPGRIVAVHTMDLTTGIGRDGFLSVIDFRGVLIRLMQKLGFYYHSEIKVWKDPVVEVTRTKNIQLLYHQFKKDSTISRQSLPDTITIFRKPGKNEEPVMHYQDLEEFVKKNNREPKNKHEKSMIMTNKEWAKLASPVWMDINQSKTLNFRHGKAENDERHISALQLDVIERVISLWSNPEDIIFSPFGGVGSEPYQAVKMGRKAISIELKESYFKQSTKNVEELENKQDQLTLF